MPGARLQIDDGILTLLAWVEIGVESVVRRQATFLQCRALKDVPPRGAVVNPGRRLRTVTRPEQITRPVDVSLAGFLIRRAKIFSNVCIGSRIGVLIFYNVNLDPLANGAKVGGAFDRVRRLPRLVQRRQQHAHKQCDNSNHHQKFDKRECTGAASRHDLLHPTSKFPTCFPIPMQRRAARWCGFIGGECYERVWRKCTVSSKSR